MIRETKKLGREEERKKKKKKRGRRRRRGKGYEICKLEKRKMKD